jgi:hypothetical protein
LKSSVSKKSNNSSDSLQNNQNIEEFDYKSNDRIFGGDYSEKLSFDNKKSISISELSGIPSSNKSPSIKNSKKKKKKDFESHMKDLISKARINQSIGSQTQSKFGSIILFGESINNGIWELQNPIHCSKHKDEEVMYWDSEFKELLCGQCLLNNSPNRMINKANLKNIHKSLPHIKQTIEDTVNDVNLQWQFLKNKRKELQICQGSLKTQRKSLENKFRIEIKEFFSHCVDIKDEKVSNLKNHFKNISSQFDEGLKEMKEKESFLESVTNTFEKLVENKTSTEKTIDFYCENIHEIDEELSNVRTLNDKVESLGGKGLFHYSNENGQIWFLKYLLGFYEKLSEFVFNRKTFFKEKLNSFEKNLSQGLMEFTELPSLLGKQSSSDQNLVINSNLKTRVHKHGRIQYSKRSNPSQVINLTPQNINFHSQMNNELPSSNQPSEKKIYKNYLTPTNGSKIKKLPEIDNLSELKEEISKHPLDSQLYHNESGQVYNHSNLHFKRSNVNFQSRRSNKKSNIFSHKKQNFSNPVIDSNFNGYEHSDPYYKFSNRKNRKKNFTTTPKNGIGNNLSKKFNRKSQAMEFEVTGHSHLGIKSSTSKNESGIVNTSKIKAAKFNEKAQKQIETKS